MKRSEVRVCVLRIEGTNSEEESAAAFAAVGARAEIVHLKQLLGQDTRQGEARRLDDYDVLFIPGGFSAGDYVRAGAILAARIKTRLWDEVSAFVGDGRLVLGVCNGFQVLTEIGLLPWGPDGRDREPDACLYTNDVGHYECRPVLLRNEAKRANAFTSTIPTGEVRTLIASHGEGKFYVDRDDEAKIMRTLEDNDQIVFRYVDPDGNVPSYPWNPNGSPSAIAGVSNREGNVLGLMPHPERVFWRHQHPDWTRTGLDVRGADVGDGRAIFESAVAHCERTR